MKKFLKIALLSLGSLVVLVVLLVAGYAYFVGKPQDVESKGWAEALTKTVAGQWDMADVKACGDPELFKAAPEPKLAQYLAWFKDRLGPLVAIEETKGDSNDYFDLGHMSVRTTARYVIQAKFEKGKGEIQMTLIKHDDKWWLLGLNVNSPLLVDLPPGAR